MLLAHSTHELHPQPGAPCEFQCVICLATALTSNASAMIIDSLSLSSGNVPTKSACRRKLTKLMTNHIFRNINWNVAPAIIYSNRMSHHLRENGACPRPSTHNLTGLSSHLIFRSFASASDLCKDLFLVNVTYYYLLPTFLCATAENIFIC